MANINDKTLQELNKQLNAKWDTAFRAGVQDQLNILATTYTSTSASNFYAFMEAMGSWTEWNGARQFADLSSQQFEVKNKEFEKSIKIPKTEFEDDQSSLYIDVVPEMVEGWFKKQQKLIMDVLTDNPIAFDGTALFSDARTYGSSTINNITTAVLSAASFKAAYIAIQSYLDHAGEPLATKPDTLVVGPKLAQTASDLLGNVYRGDGETSAVQIMNYYNTLGVRLVVSPYLIGAYDDYWYLADTKSVIKGVLLQIRESPAPLLSNAQEVARSRSIDYMCNGRMAAAAGAPHKIYRGDGTA